MRGDILVKIFAGALFAAGVIMAILVFALWHTFVGVFAVEYPIFAVLGVAALVFLCAPQIVGGLLSWHYGSVARAMALDPLLGGQRHMALRVFIGITGLVLLGVVGLGGVTLALDFGFSGVCGIILVVLAVVGPQKIAGV